MEKVPNKEGSFPRLERAHGQVLGLISELKSLLAELQSTGTGDVRALQSAINGLGTAESMIATQMAEGSNEEATDALDGELDESNPDWGGPDPADNPLNEVL